MALENLKKVMQKVMESHGVWRAQKSMNPVHDQELVILLLYDLV